MCDKPMPCACTSQRRRELLEQHVKRADELESLAHRLRTAGSITDDEAHLIYQQANAEWDDAIHIASPDDPLRSLCGSYGRNLMDLPERPDAWAGCWGCLQRAALLEEREPQAGNDVAEVAAPATVSRSVSGEAVSLSSSSDAHQAGGDASVLALSQAAPVDDVPLVVPGQLSLLEVA